MCRETSFRDGAFRVPFSNEHRAGPQEGPASSERRGPDRDLPKSEGPADWAGPLLKGRTRFWALPAMKIEISYLLNCTVSERPRTKIVVPEAAAAIWTRTFWTPEAMPHSQLWNPTTSNLAMS